MSDTTFENYLREAKNSLRGLFFERRFKNTYAINHAHAFTRGRNTLGSREYMSHDIPDFTVLREIYEREMPGFITKAKREGLTPNDAAAIFLCRVFDLYLESENNSDSPLKSFADCIRHATHVSMVPLSPRWQKEMDIIDQEYEDKK